MIQPNDLLQTVRARREQTRTLGHVLDSAGKTYPIWPVAYSTENANALRDLVIRQGARRTLEIGLGLAQSTLAIIEALCTTHGHSPLAAETHTVIDPGQAWCNRAGVRELDQSGARAITRFIEQPSHLALPQLVASNERFDLAFVDGMHLFDYVLLDVFYCMRLVKPNGLIILDDHWMPAIQTVLGFAVTNWDAKLELFDPKGPARRMVAFANPFKDEQRPWDHFAEFSAQTLPEYAWKRNQPRGAPIPA